MDRRKKALADYKKLQAFFAEEEERFLQEADKEEGSLEDEDMDPVERFKSLLQALSELERRHRNLGLSMLLQVGNCPAKVAGQGIRSRRVRGAAHPAWGLQTPACSVFEPELGERAIQELVFLLSKVLGSLTQSQIPKVSFGFWQLELISSHGYHCG